MMHDDQTKQRIVYRRKVTMRYIQSTLFHNFIFLATTTYRNLNHVFEIVQRECQRSLISILWHFRTRIYMYMCIQEDMLSGQQRSEINFRSRMRTAQPSIILVVICCSLLLWCRSSRGLGG